MLRILTIFCIRIPCDDTNFYTNLICLKMESLLDNSNVQRSVFVCFNNTQKSHHLQNQMIKSWKFFFDCFCLVWKLILTAQRRRGMMMLTNIAGIHSELCCQLLNTRHTTFYIICQQKKIIAKTLRIIEFYG